MDDLAVATIKAVPTLGIALITLLLGWFVTGRVTARWDLRKKRTELSLDALHRFYSLYGEFFAVWKLWQAWLENRYPAEKRAESRSKLLERAAANEGMYESFIVKLTDRKSVV